MTPTRITTGVLAVLRWLLAAGSILMTAGSVGTAAAGAGTAAPGCVLDGVTGVPVPREVRGVCVTRTAERALLVQRSDEGLLIAALDDASSATAVAGEAGDMLSMHGAKAHVVFCPTSLLAAASGAPTAACLARAEPLEPGPGALAGSGFVRADVRLDGAGVASCPASVRIAADVAASPGMRFALIASLAMLDTPGRPDSCAAAYDRVELNPGAAARSAAGDTVAGSPAMGQSRLEQLMQLDDEQWRVVDTLLALTPQDWRTFEAVVQSAAAPDVAAAANPGTPAVPIEPAGVADVVNQILARVNAIRSNLDALTDRIPDRADVRSLVAQIDIDRLRDMLGDVRDSIQGLLDIARELRDGYESFDVAQFRARLGGVLTDVESATTLYQRLLCIDDPDITIRPISMMPLRRLIDRAPGVALYALSKILETIDPNWDRRIGDAVDAVPPEVTGLCHDGLRPAAPQAVDFENEVCKVLRRKPVGAALKIAKIPVAVALVGFRFAKNHTKEEIQATVGADVVAGGTAGTSVKNPAHTVVEQWVDRLDNLKEAIKDVIDRRKDCLDADHDIEDGLRDCAKDACVCTAPLSVVLHGDVPPTYAYVADLVDVRIGQAEDAGLPDIAQARSKHDEATNGTNDETAAGYGKLCQAYAYLLQPTGIAPPAPPPAGPPSRPKPQKPGPGR